MYCIQQTTTLIQCNQTTVYLTSRNQNTFVSESNLLLSSSVALLSCLSTSIQSNKVYSISNRSILVLEYLSCSLSLHLVSSSFRFLRRRRVSSSEEMKCYATVSSIFIPRLLTLHRIFRTNLAVQDTRLSLSIRVFSFEEHCIQFSVFSFTLYNFTRNIPPFLIVIKNFSIKRIKNFILEIIQKLLD